MDPLTQGVVGAAASQASSKKNTIIIASFIGLLSGLAPDLDIFIRSDIDPLLFLQYHRHFTHSLLFIPFGALICATVFYYLFARKYCLSFKQTYIYSFLGYATHGFIDSFTTYGTLLLWPFADDRIAWNTVSVIDPIFTIPILIFVTAAVLKKNNLFSVYALVWIMLYQTVAYSQKIRAESIISKYANTNGHDIQTIEAKPSFGNIIVWKVIYTSSEKYHVNAIRLGLKHRIYHGQSVDKLDINKSFPWLSNDHQQAQDLEKFKWFSNGYLGIDKNDSNVIYDIRFSSLPNEVEGLWGVRLNETKSKDEHVDYVTNRNRDINRFIILLKMIFDKYED